MNEIDISRELANLKRELNALSGNAGFADFVIGEILKLPLQKQIFVAKSIIANYTKRLEERLK